MAFETILIGRICLLFLRQSNIFKIKLRKLASQIPIILLTVLHTVFDDSIASLSRVLTRTKKPFQSYTTLHPSFIIELIIHWMFLPVKGLIMNMLSVF